MELAFTFGYNLLAFIIIISIIVFAHEFGHYYIARLGGVKIEVFSIGFGRELFGWTDKVGTRWKVCLVPAGGYVKMFGDVDPASAPDRDKIDHFTEEEKKVAFHTKPLSIKAAVVAAGPIANFLFAIVVLVGFYLAYGKPYTPAIISDVMAESAAEEAGLQSGDRIVMIDGSSVETFDDITKAIAINLGEPVDVVIERDGAEIDVVVTPKIVERESFLGEVVKTPMLGITSSEVSYQDLHLGTAFTAAIAETWFIGKATLQGLGQIVTGARSSDDISGPIRIAKFSGQSMERGFHAVLWFMVVISVNLGLINLFPIPLLDGGHLMYYAIEALQGRPLADKVQEYGFRLGFAMIIALAVFATFNDIRSFDLF